MIIRLENFADNLYEEIEGINYIDEELSLEEVRKAALMLLKKVYTLKEFILCYEFTGKEEEIHFFKNIKPRFQSRLIYYQKLFQIMSDVPAGLTADIHLYYIDQFEKIKKYLNCNNDFFTYYKSGSKLFDDIYFVRKEPDLWLSIMENEFETDPFTTIYDNKLSKLLAYEQLTSFLISRIVHIEINPRDPSGAAPIKWTASKAALIELLYALQTSGSFNNGTVDVKQLATHFENFFNVKLGNFYRTFQEIRIRKINRTTFMDQLKENLIKRMDSTDESPKY